MRLKTRPDVDAFQSHDLFHKKESRTITETEDKQFNIVAEVYLGDVNVRLDIKDSARDQHSRCSPCLPCARRG